ncbi:MAG: amino acid dehydrogenase [Hyphomicrobiales bacterium]|nr:MAG: amino acid dehydrogenase [Hyphomicrobiales bacterium]
MSAKTNPYDVMVLGAGIVGVSSALELQSRGIATILVDQQSPGLGASFGNSGVIQREAVMPYAMPRDFKTLFTTLMGQNTAARLHLTALPGLLPFFARYWWYSSQENHRKQATSYATLIERCVDAYEHQISGTGAKQYLKPQGILAGFRDDKSFRAAKDEAEYAASHFGIKTSYLENETAIQQAIPHIKNIFSGMVRYHDSITVSDPHALLTELFKKFKILGGEFAKANAFALARAGETYSLIGDSDLVTAKHAVIALGAHAPELTRKFGLKIPMGIKRGYHVHFEQDPQAPLEATFADEKYGFVLTPKAEGIRLTTGAEFAGLLAAPTPKQLEQVIPIAQKLHPLGARIEKTPWMGLRPCMPDMLPIISNMPGHDNLWCAFGHGHQGLTLGPITGVLIADLVMGQQPSIDLAPFAASRFS